MSELRLAPSAEQFGGLFPFHLAFDARLTVVQTGGLWQRMCPQVASGTSMVDHFRLLRPPIAIEFATIREQTRSIFLLECRHNGVVFRGQMVLLEDAGVLLFLCSPWITDVADVTRLGISLSDLAIHDAAADFLFLLRSKDSALRDATTLAQKLTEQRAALRGANEAMQESEAWLRAIRDTAADGIVTIDDRGTIKSWNKAAADIFGYEAADVIGRNVSILMPSPDREQHDAYLARYLQTGEARIIGTGRQVTGMRRDGSTFPLYLAVSDMRVGGLRSFSGIVRDLTASRRAEQALRDSEERLRMVVNSSLDAMIAIDASGLVTEWNTQAEQMFRWRRAEVLGRQLSSTIIPPRYRDAHDKGLREAAQTGQGAVINQRIEITAQDRSGTEFPVELTVAAAHSGGRWMFSAFVRDIRDRKRAEAELLEAKEAAEAANRAKSEFLATMSHEIRTPMNGVIGMSGLLLDTPLSPGQRDYAETVRKSAESLLGIINDILDFSKIEAGKLDLEVIDFDLRAVVEEVGDLLGETAARKGLELSAEFDPAVPTVVRGDPGRVRQILTNLVGNAIKFTVQGEVVVRAAPAAEGDGRVHFVVTDTGPGIAPEAQSRLFQPFSQADSSTTRRYGGTGLGLAICKRLVDLMGGAIGVDSAPGRGSAFWFVIPLPAGAQEADAAPDGALEGLRVLVVDDNATNRTLLAQQLPRWGVECVTVASGEEALAALRAAAAQGTPYHAALLDLQMPDMDGIDLARTIKGDARLAATPLLLLSSLGARDQVEAAHVAGIGAVLNKPLRMARLRECLFGLLRGQTTAPAPPLPAPPTGRRVLVAEDNAVNQRVAILLLEKLGYRADAVGNGLEAVEASQRIPYDLVLMDCQMPELDGYEATARIRALEGSHRHVPIVAMTANAMQGDRDRCLAAGMDDYIAKPVREGELAAVLSRWTASAAPASRRGGDAGIDRAVIADLHQLTPDGEPSIVDELIDAFVEDTPAQLAAMRAAVAAGDARALDAAAHRLKGGSGALGARRLAALCAQIEGLARVGALDDAVLPLEALADEFHVVRADLERLRSAAATTNPAPA